MAIGYSVMTIGPKRLGSTIGLFPTTMGWITLFETFACPPIMLSRPWGLDVSYEASSSSSSL